MYVRNTMSPPSIRSESNTLEESETTGKGTTGFFDTVRRTVVLQVRAAGFWLSIALPFLYLPLLTGLNEWTHVMAFLGLLVLNLTALLLGRHHSPQ